jgi:hypothetical protein
MRRVLPLLMVGLLGAATAWAANPSAPSATTGGAGGVGTDVATLTGTVDSGNADTPYWFAYGTSTGYGLTSSTQTTPAAAAPATVTATITSLTPATVYHYRLTATNPAGDSNGNDATLTTPVAPGKPTPTTGSATGVSTSGATLNATIKPNTLDTTYVFQYGTSTAYGATTPSADIGAGTSSIAVKQAIGGLKASTTYHYRVVATNSLGAVNGSDHSFKTTAAAPRPSVATSNPTRVGPGSATLNGKVNPNGFATSYVFQYGTSKSYGSTTPSQSAGGGKATINASTAITGLRVHTTYHFRIVATNANGTSDGGDHSFYTASGALAVTLGLRPDPVVYGHGVALVGTVNGAGGGVPVTLHSLAFPFSGPFGQVGNAQLTAANGSFRFLVAAASIRTRYYATAALTGAVLTSPTVISRVRVRVGLMVSKLGGHLVRFSGTVLPAVQSAVVSIQRRSRNGQKWTRVAHANLVAPARPGAALRFAKRVRIGSGGVFRAVVLPNDGSAHTRNVSRLRTIRFH